MNADLAMLRALLSSSAPPKVPDAAVDTSPVHGSVYIEATGAVEFSFKCSALLFTAATRTPHVPIRPTVRPGNPQKHKTGRISRFLAILLALQ